MCLSPCHQCQHGNSQCQPPLVSSVRRWAESLAYGIPTIPESTPTPLPATSATNRLSVMVGEKAVHPLLNHQCNHGSNQCKPLSISTVR